VPAERSAAAVVPASAIAAVEAQPQASSPVATGTQAKAETANEAIVGADKTTAMAAPAETAKPAAAPAAIAKAAPAAPAEIAKAAPVQKAAPPPAALPSAPKKTLAAAPANADLGPLHSHSPLLVVHGVPDNVRLWLDGQRMANPFDIRLPRGTKHRIEARADGYETSAQTVRIESDAKLTIAVRRSPPVRVRGVAAPPPSRSEPTKPVDKHRRGVGFVSVSPY
jgi:hypothetical protein